MNCIKNESNSLRVDLYSEDCLMCIWSHHPFYFFLFGSGDLNFGDIFDKNALAPILFKGCFSQANKNLQEKGIIGIWDYECAASQVDYLHEFGRHISERFYYVNYALLLFMLIYGKINCFQNILNCFLL